MCRKTFQVRVAAAVILCVFALAAAGQAAEEADLEAGQPDSLSASIEKLLETSEEAVGTQPPPPEEILDIYGRARATLDRARSDLALLETLQNELQEAPARLPRLKAQLEKEPEPLPDPPPPEATSAEVERLHTEALERLRALEKTRDMADARSRELERRVGEIPDEVSRASKALADARKRLEDPLPMDKPAGMEAAAQLRREAAVLGAEIALRLLEVERKHAGIGGEVIRAELALAEDEIEWAQIAEEHAAKALKTKRHEKQFEFLRRAREMQNTFAEGDPTLAGLCTENADLAEKACGPDGIFARLHGAADQKRSVDLQLAEIQGNFRDIRARVRLMGRTTGVGNLLIEHRDALPYGRVIENQIAADRRGLNEAQLQSFQLRGKIKEARREGSTLQDVLKTMGIAENEPGWREARRDARKILDLRRELMAEISQSYTQYQRVLSETIAAEEELLKTVMEMTSFVEEKVLWVRSQPPLNPESFRLAGRAVHGVSWGRIASDVSGDLRDGSRAHPFLSYGFLLAVILILAARTRMRRRIQALGPHSREHSSGTFLETLETALWTLLLGLSWPALAWAAAWRLAATPPNAAATAGLAQALNTIGFVLAPLCLIRAIALPEGLGETHLGMDRTRLAVVRKAMLGFFPLVLPVVFVNAAMNAKPTTDLSLSLGRLFGIGGLLISALLLGILFRRNGPLIRGSGSRGGEGFLHRRWWLWYPAVVGVPVLLAGASAWGFDYTAVKLTARIIGMILLALGLVIVRAVVLLGLRLLRRQMIGLVFNKSRKARGKQDGRSDSKARKEMLREAVERVTAAGDRTEGFARFFLWTLFLFGLYLMWRDVLPALRFLTRTNLYSVGEVLVTLADLLAAGVYAAVTVIAVRILPGILDIYVFPRFNLQVGVGSALSTFTRYLLAMVGVACVCSRLGITWTNIQWIVAALGVGLGFGLQELVANFLSGILLLIDGRIRRLDVVTVGDTCGRVTAIRTMATTITDWNNRDVVIPNKDLTSGRVVNWTLSERAVRLDIPVGIAYGSDTREAEEILVRIGRDNGHTLDDPPVRALFLGFGDSSLQFELRVWVNTENFLETTHELHRSIDGAFREAGISIAFPQLDVHLDSPSRK